MNCRQCNNEFNDTTHRPKLLPKCGDSVCAACLDVLRSTGDEFCCPTDGIVYSRSTEIFDNAYMLNFLVPSRSNQTHCAKHNKELELHCGDCDIEICASCVLFGEHKSHRYEQLAEFKARFADKLTEFHRKLEQMERGVSQKIADVSVQIQKSRNEKMQQLDLEFDDLIAHVTRTRNVAKDAVNAAYESVLSAGELLRSRMKNLSGKIAECAKGKSRLKEDYLLRELRDLELSYEKSDLYRGKEAIAARTELNFCRTTVKNVSGFVTVGRAAVLGSTPKSLTKSKFDGLDEDNLLQESFKELLKGSADSPLEDSEKPEERTPTGRPFAAQKSFSPVSAYSNGPSTRSLNARKEEKGIALVNQTLADPRKLSLSPTNNSVLARSQVVRSGVVISPFKPPLAKSSTQEKENQDILTNMKIMDRRSSVVDRVQAQFESVAAGRSTILDLSSAGLDDRGLEALGRRWGELRACKTIKLNNNMITEQGLKLLLKSIKELSVEYLFLNNNCLKETALDYFISFRKYNAALKCIYLNNNSITKSSSKARLKLKLLEEGSISVVF